MMGDVDFDQQATGASAPGAMGVYMGPRRIIGPGELFGEISFFTGGWVWIVCGCMGAGVVGCTRLQVCSEMCVEVPAVLCCGGVFTKAGTGVIATTECAGALRVCTRLLLSG